MNAASLEWVAKAEADWSTAQREARARQNPNFDAVCFHCQQCAEKYLKAILVNAGVAHPRIHDLERLLDLVEPLAPLLAPFRPTLGDLSDYAVEYRYPGESANREEAKKSIRDTRDVRKAIRAHLLLPV